MPVERGARGSGPGGRYGAKEGGFRGSLGDSAMGGTRRSAAAPPGTDGDTFEVAWIKPAQRPQVPVAGSVPASSGRWRPLISCIRFEYPTANGQVFVDSKAPGWVTTDRFDVIAKSAGPQPSAAMLRALLAERFKLRARLEAREGTVFELTLARADGRLGEALIASHCGSDNELPPATADEALARAMSPKAPPHRPRARRCASAAAHP